VPLCLLTPDMQNRRILNDNFAAAGTVATPTVETNSISTLCSHVRRGWSSVMAHAWLSLFGVPEAMRAVPLVAPEVTHSIGIVVPDVEPLSPLADALVELSRRLDLEGELDRLVAGSRARRPSTRKR
jgi:hypothetical protein